MSGALLQLQLFLHQLLHLLDEVGLYIGGGVDFFHGGALLQGLIHLEVAFAGRGIQLAEKVFLGHRLELLHMAESEASLLQGTDGLLEGFFIVLADAHDFADGTHLGSQMVLDALELLKGPAGELHDHIVAVRHILVQGAVLAAGKVCQGKACSELCGNQRDGEAGCLGGKGGRTGGTRVDLDDDDTVALGIMGKLYVGAADDADVLYNLVGLLLKALLHLLGDGQHRCGTEGITGMHAHGVDVLDEADGNHVAGAVADNLQLQLFPSEDGLFYENLMHKACLKASCADGLQLILIINKAAAGTTHGIGGSQNDGISQLVGNGERFFHRVGNLAAGHFNTKLIHGLLELDAIFAAFDGVNLNTDYLDIVLVQHTGLIEFCAEIQSGLSAQVRQQGVGTLFADDLLKTVHIEGLNVGNIRHLRICHDGGRVGIYQNDLISETAKRFARLRAGIVKFTGLSDDDRTGADDQYLANICSLWHLISSCIIICK